jgi:hypothetical protein
MQRGLGISRALRLGVLLSFPSTILFMTLIFFDGVRRDVENIKEIMELYCQVIWMLMINVL